MRMFTSISFLFTLAVGTAAFRSDGASAELLKLLYAYLALTTVVCGLIAIAARKPAAKSIAAVPEIKNSAPVALNA
jgi:hypothetical protein